MSQNSKSNSSKGFTLMELMIVMGIIGILASYAIPNFIAYRDKAFCSQAEQNAKNTLTALSAYYANPNHTGMPSSDDLVNFEGLSLNYSTTSVALTGSVTGTIMVIVTDESNRCPRGNVFRLSMGGAAGNWSTN